MIYCSRLFKYAKVNAVNTPLPPPRPSIAPLFDHAYKKSSKHSLTALEIPFNILPAFSVKIKA